jgi:hypothetical protein
VKCIVCGCTDDHGCLDGCWWQSVRGRLVPLCSSCSAPPALVEVVIWAAEHACDGMGTCWKPKPKRRRSKAEIEAIANATCVSMKARKKCVPCRARLLMWAA